jgi:antimicrobial peptide system SdpA family protein
MGVNEKQQILMRVTKGAILAMWSALLLFVVAGSIAGMPLSLGQANRSRLLTVLPEGWAFFTRDPREATPRIFVRDESGHWVAHGQGESRVANWLGLKRDNRVTGIELEKLMAKVPKAKHVHCEGELDKCLATQKVPVARVVDEMLVKTLKGEIVVAAAEPVPWAWSASRSEINMPSDVVKLNVIWK